MKGYKAFCKDMTCRGFQYEVGKTYKHDGKIKIGESGFHFCKRPITCYWHYKDIGDVIICRVEATGKIESNDGINFVTDEITILSKVSYPKSKTNFGGKENSGMGNCGYGNSGNFNLGGSNSGTCNRGGNNTGWFNEGQSNTGFNNLGSFNSGSDNDGDGNSGRRNSGDFNSGCWNSGNYSSGVFNTNVEPKMFMFDKLSDWTILDWTCSKAKKIMDGCPRSYIRWVDEINMTKEEKKIHSEYKVTGGFLKRFEVDKQKWWDELSESDKSIIYALPNFDKEKFEKCVGVKI